MRAHPLQDLRRVADYAQPLPAVPDDYPQDQQHGGVGDAHLLVDLAQQGPAEQPEEDEEDRQGA